MQPVRQLFVIYCKTYKTRVLVFCLLSLNENISDFTQSSLSAIILKYLDLYPFKVGLSHASIYCVDLYYTFISFSFLFFLLCFVTHRS